MKGSQLSKGMPAALVCLSVSSAHAQLIFSDNLDSGANWVVNGTSDTTATFGFDYSTLGIPASPNGGGTTTGLRMTANETSGAIHEISAAVAGLDISGQYVVEFDFWINANGPFPAGGAGSTEFAGGGVGFRGNDVGLDGASLIVTGEGGASRDWRLYKNKGEQFIASAQYNPLLTTNNNTDTLLATTFPGQSAPAFQQANFAQQTGTLANGTAGFAWRTMRITVDSNAIGSGINQNPGIARFEVDGFFIGRIDNSNGGTVVDMTGSVGLIYADLFTSVSNNPTLSFGVFDNFRVFRSGTAAPEPGTFALLALGGVCAGIGWRRQRKNKPSR
ncbi:MAG: hypothetical protein OHK0029_42950 [Armatimonadaceae bacterium]